jgi:hypothetical protein
LNDYYEEKEMYLKTESLIKFLFDWQCDKEKFYDCVLDLSEEMAKRDYWSKEEVVCIRHFSKVLILIIIVVKMRAILLTNYMKKLSHLNISKISAIYQIIL